jgi:CheY-like chemotaxis protein/anti-sigma regulatory factor (Ser/Thr protein kinase)
VSLHVDAQCHAEGPCWVRADAARLRQVLLNLISNAIKYNRAGGQVQMVCDNQDEHMTLHVRDTGLGMDATQLAALFQPFNRLGRESLDVQGTGIGLVIARNLTHLMAGTLTAKSQPGVGSEFILRLPRARHVAGPAEAPASAPAKAVLTRQDVQGRVLYVDDNEVNRVLMEVLLERRPNVTLLLAEDGPSGLQLARTQAPDLVLLDIRLPGMDGYEILRHLRADPRLGGLPCLAVSAGAMPDDIAQAAAAGFDGYLTKPLDLGLLLNEIDRRLAPH